MLKIVLIITVSLIIANYAALMAARALCSDLILNDGIAFGLLSDYGEVVFALSFVMLAALLACIIYFNFKFNTLKSQGEPDEPNYLKSSTLRRTAPKDGLVLNSSTPKDGLIKKLIYALSLIVGGAASNLAERMIYGHVTDYIPTYIPTPSSLYVNLADIEIMVGSAAVLVLIYKIYKFN